MVEKMYEATMAFPLSRSSYDWLMGICITHWASSCRRRKRYPLSGCMLLFPIDTVADDVTETEPRRQPCRPDPDDPTKWVVTGWSSLAGGAAVPVDESILVNDQNWQFQYSLPLHTLPFLHFRHLHYD